MRVSIVIPALNEAGSLGATLDALPGTAEVIVADGGSSDNTVAMARNRGIRVLASSRGRGVQMHAGAQAASGEVLWFLHADSIPDRTAVEEIVRALGDLTVVAGNFTLRFSGSSFGARFLNRLYPMLAWIGLRYGDSGIFVRRSVYEECGGFAAYPIFEDLDLLRRLRRYGRFVTLPGPLTTSSRRFEGRSFFLTFLRWFLMQLLYWAGVNPCRLGRFYQPIR